MAGLQKLVKYRGGLGSLESAPLALGKLYRYGVQNLNLELLLW